MSEIVRTDTLFGSKKNIIGSTSADLVLETLGKVYIKTGKSAKTLTEILSEYSKKSGNETSGTGNITTEQILNLLSAEYIKSLVDLVLKEHKIYGNFVTIESLQGVGNLNLPIYFDINSEPQTITGLEVTNKIYTDDEVRGERGVSTAGVCDLTIIGGYNYGLNPADLEEYHFTNPTQVEAIIQRLLDEEVRNTYKPLQTSIVDSLIGSNVKTISNLTLDIYGVINATFVDIPDAASDQKGFINTVAQSFSGAKTFLTSITSPEVNTPLIKTQSQLTIQTNNANRANFYSEGLSVNGGVSANGIIDLTIIGGYSIDPSLLNALGTFRGTYESVNDLPDNTMISSLDVNDYAFIIEEVNGDPEYARYKYDGSSWIKEYVLNNSAFTDIQWTTINSGLTSTGKNTITTLGTITTGTWNASAIADDYISSASAWNSASSTISTISEYFDSNNKLKQANLDATAIINALGNNAVNRATSDRNGLIIDTNYLKSDGSKSMTGTLELRTNAYKLDSTAGLDCKNSDIINVNSIYTGDVSGSWKESIAFVRSGGTTYDTFRAAGGTFYFGFNNIHTNQDTSGNEYVTLTDREFKIERSDRINNTAIDTLLKVTNYNGSISLLTSTNRGVYDSSTSTWLIATNGTNTFLNEGNVGIGTVTPGDYKLYIEGNLKATGNVVLGDNTKAYNTILSNHTILYNGFGLYWQGYSANNNSTIDNYQVLMVNNYNELHIGYGTGYKGGDTTVLNGGSIYLRSWINTLTHSDILFSKNKTFYPSVSNDIDLGTASYTWKRIYGYDVIATRGVAAGGIADLTIAYSNSVILSLQALIDALQDQIDALS